MHDRSSDPVSKRISSRVDAYYLWRHSTGDKSNRISIWKIVLKAVESAVSFLIADNGIYNLMIT